MYNKKVNQVEATETKNYLDAGINEGIFVKSVVYGNWTNGECADITFSNEAGSIITDRVFPFNYSGGKFTKKDANGAVVALTETEEEDNYLLRFKHIFSATVGSENYDKAVSKATDFKSFITILNSISRDSYAASKSFRMMLISKQSTKDNKYYTIVPRWTNGFIEAEGDSPKMKFDATKYGKKNVEAAKVEDTSKKDENSLPF